MDDPQAIADRYRRVAQSVVTETAAIADRAFAKINAGATTNPVDSDTDAPPTAPPPYTAGDALATLSSLITVAVTGAINLARVPLQSMPESQPLLMADHLATVAARVATDVDQVAQQAAADVDANAFTPNRWVDTAIRLSSIGMIRGAEVIETVGAGPGRYTSPERTSDPIDVGVDEEHDRPLRVTSLQRPGLGSDIAALARFGPAEAVVTKGSQPVLLRGHSTVTLTVNAAGIPSGLYLGEISVGEATLPVAIAL
ncbi:hypothetical protein [Mycolicibacterium tokaiense]|uniref:Uncharacterized protein n=1 Tax=Mycolicibacterium tokaiense TaxID=39695 RepID=A0A378TB04_9MYCO|nr:hypothetical protein [Mycolicibacterium tokaiense]BBY87507.1 hypothetical protein MTOK_32890 [Mycolicibacterium tokaiense]STZ57971.1 Uncharacterised protein [Mycolicibacterium tokaiense]